MTWTVAYVEFCQKNAPQDWVLSSCQNHVSKPARTSPLGPCQKLRNCAQSYGHAGKYIQILLMTHVLQHLSDLSAWRCRVGRASSRFVLDHQQRRSHIRILSYLVPPTPRGSDKEQPGQKSDFAWTSVRLQCLKPWDACFYEVGSRLKSSTLRVHIIYFDSLGQKSSL